MLALLRQIIWERVNPPEDVGNRREQIGVTDAAALPAWDKPGDEGWPAVLEGSHRFIRREPLRRQILRLEQLEHARVVLCGIQRPVCGKDADHQIRAGDAEHAAAGLELLHCLFGHAVAPR